MTVKSIDLSIELFFIPVLNPFVNFTGYMKGYFIKFICLTAAYFSVFSCSTDVDLQADWEDITVVIGLLDQNDETHFIKINKAFLGSGNAFTYAQVRDSSEYDVSKVDAVIEEKINGNVNRTFQLRDTLLSNKEQGIFYAPQHTLYYFEADDLNPNADYELNIEINESNNSPKLVAASTPLVKSFIMSKPSANQSATIAFVLGTLYHDEEVRWASAENGKRYEVQLVLNYLEVNAADDTVKRAITWNLGTQRILDLSGGTQMSKFVAGEDFYKWVSDKITTTPELNSNDVTHRIFRGVDFKITVAADELNTYMELNEPVTGIVQERPAYTNVGNGIGIFSARYSVSRQGKWLNRASIEELYGGQYTNSLHFCSDSLGLWPNNDSDPSWCQ